MPEFDQTPRAVQQQSTEPDSSLYDLAHEERASRRFFFIGMPAVLLAVTLPLSVFGQWLSPERAVIVTIPFVWFVFHLIHEVRGSKSLVVRP